LIDADRTDTADFANGAAAALRQHGRYTEWGVLADLLERKLTGFSSDSPIDRLRGQVSESCLSASVRPRGTYLLTVPTGGGKTLASLRFALNHASKWEMDRVIYVSPYTSIIDQNADVVRGVLEPEGTEFASVVLEHHSNLTPLKQTWKDSLGELGRSSCVHNGGAITRGALRIWYSRGEAHAPDGQFSPNLRRNSDTPYSLRSHV
jgi:CRISPR-associated endonuclease/helicase Cas3